uniref:Reverse transcriptase Ty1/copia-type domain-containing protein n=1 Tax=Fagus sylvatica TaxID=28930 RepID=A0A2N9F0E1_FAGSY
MAQPQGFIDQSQPGYVCKLHKSLYGLKQAPRAWFERFTSQLENLGFTASSADPSLFIYKSHNEILYLLLYVDDIVLTGTSPSLITNLITKLQQTFELKDLGPLHYFLGLQLQPDLSFAVNQVRQFMHSPTDTHMVAAKRILRYLKGTLNHGLLFRPSSLTLQAYADADWAGNSDDRRSTSGYVVFLGSTPITWVSKKQSTVSRSSTEAEYRSLASATAEVFWIRTVLKDLGVFLLDPPLLWCDNLSTIALASNPVFHAKTKHIEVDYHFIREKVVRRDIVVKFISTTDQLADILTKCLSSPSFHRLRENLLLSFRPP